MRISSGGKALKEEFKGGRKVSTEKILHAKKTGRASLGGVEGDSGTFMYIIEYRC